jgi:hypothetical protein
VTGVTSGVMVVLVFVIGDLVLLVIGVTSGATVVFIFVVGDVLMLVMGEVRSPCCYIGEARKSIRGTI